MDHFKMLKISFLLFPMVVKVIMASSNVTSNQDYLMHYVFKAAGTSDAGIAVPHPLKEITFNRTFVELYYDGVDAYLSNDWGACINHMERSNHLYRGYYDKVSSCRVSCEFERNRYIPKHMVNYDHRHFYEKLIVKTLCLEKCRMKNLSYLPRYFVLTREDRELFKSRKSYEYLQLCYYKTQEIFKAISAAYTALVVNPEDKVLIKNIEYYSKLDEYDLTTIKDFEDKRFSPFYQDAIDKYEAKEWAECIELMEIALDTWLQEIDKCRAFCESEFDQGWLPDFTTSVSNHYVYALRCKQNCSRDLSFVNGRYYEDLYPSMYNYLQFSYYQVGKIEEATRCVGSYLLFYPESEDMLGNFNFYNDLPATSEKYLQPRDEATIFTQRAIYEMDLVVFVDNQFNALATHGDYFLGDTVESLSHLDRTNDVIEPLIVKKTTNSKVHNKKTIKRKAKKLSKINVK